MDKTEEWRRRWEIAGRYPDTPGTRCAVHGGSGWRGGYCDLWAVDPGKGPCVRSLPPSRHLEDDWHGGSDDGNRS